VVDAKNPLVRTRGFFKGLGGWKPPPRLARGAVFGAFGCPLAGVGVGDALAEADVERGGFDEFVGINASDEAYQKTIKAYGYQISPAMFGLSLYGAWMEEDPRAGMAWCEKISGRLGADLTRYFLNYWLKIDAPAALAYAKEQQMQTANLDRFPSPFLSSQ